MSQLYSTKNPSYKRSLEEAVLAGLAPDGGLFMPTRIPHLDDSFFTNLPQMSLPSLAIEVASHLLPDALSDNVWKRIAESALTFDAPLVSLDEDTYALELFHGPTLSFKDFGARFMARLMSHFIRNSDQELHILVATSGDTGSAVAHGFLGIPGIRVWILYPSGKVSDIQEKQLTTMGQNVTALEVDGTFDDCQALVKKAFADKELRQLMQMTSANSINIARLIPQSLYYFYAYGQLVRRGVVGEDVIIAVPSGNFGNLTAGLIAKKMGLPIAHFVAATNINDSVPKYLATGHFHPRPSLHTISNAMDVGNPSNFVRMLALYKDDVRAMRRDLYGVSFTDEETAEAMRLLHSSYGYLADPHGAVAYLGLSSYRERNSGKTQGIFLETAHPAKFASTVEAIVGEKIEIPERLKEDLAKEKQSIQIANNYDIFRDILRSLDNSREAITT